MTIQQPISTDPLSSPDHSLSHRVFANDNAAPVQSVTVDSSGNVTNTYRLLQPMGEVSYFSLTGTNVVISAQSDGSTNMVAVQPATSLDVDTGFDNGGSNNGRLRYTGATTRNFHVAVTVSVSPATNNDTFVLGIAVNGSVDAGCKVVQKMSQTTDTQSTALHCMVTMAQNQYLELYAGNISGAGHVTVKTLNLFAMGM